MGAGAAITGGVLAGSEADEGPAVLVSPRNWFNSSLALDSCSGLNVGVAAVTGAGEGCASVGTGAGRLGGGVGMAVVAGGGTTKAGGTVAGADGGLIGADGRVVTGGAEGATPEGGFDGVVE